MTFGDFIYKVRFFIEKVFRFLELVHQQEIPTILRFGTLYDFSNMFLGSKYYQVT